MLPGLVLAALAGAPLVLGAAGGVLLAAAAIALAGRDERLGGDTGVAVAVSGAVRARRAARAHARGAAAACRSCCSATCSASRPPTSPSPRRSPRGVARRSRSRTGRWRWRLRPLRGALARRAPARYELALLVLLGVTTVAAAPGAGQPAARGADHRPAARQGCGSPGAGGARARAALAALAGVGLVLSFHLGVAAGASVALCAAALAGGAAAARLISCTMSVIGPDRLTVSWHAPRSRS